MSFHFDPSKQCLDAFVADICMKYLQSSTFEKEKKNLTILQQYRQEQYARSFRKWTETNRLLRVTTPPSFRTELHAERIPMIDWETMVLAGGAWGFQDRSNQAQARISCVSSANAVGTDCGNESGSSISGNHQQPIFDENGTQGISGFATGLELLHERIKEGDTEAAEALNEINNSSIQHRVAGLKQGPASAELNSKARKQHQTMASKIAEQLGGEIREDVVSVVLSMLLSAKSDTPIRRTDIAGLENVKKLVQDKIIYPIRRPDLHRGLHQAPRGILLFGPPGTGKTMIAKWVAAESRASFFEVTPSSLISKYHGETETMVRTLFRVAEVSAPSVIFIDEIDSLLGKRRDNDDDCSIRMKNQLLQMMDGVSSNTSALVVVVGATNRADSLDEAALRRLPRRILVPLPDQLAREAQIMRLLEKHQQFEVPLTSLPAEKRVPTDESHCKTAQHDLVDFRDDDSHFEASKRRRLQVGPVDRESDDGAKAPAAVDAETQQLESGVKEALNDRKNPPPQLGLSQGQLTSIAAKLEGWNCSDICALCGKAAEYSFDETVEAYGGVDLIPGASAFRPICYNDFLRALGECEATSIATGLESSRIKSSGIECSTGATASPAVQ